LPLAAVLFFASVSLGIPGRIAPAPRETGRYWLFLEDERPSPAELERRLEQTARSLTPRARARRIKALGYPGVRPCDITPSPERIAEVEASGCRVIRFVRYLNALVVEGGDEALRRAGALDFIGLARPVLAFSNDCVLESLRPDECGLPTPRYSPDEQEIYGVSWRQVAMINIPAVHRVGLRGRGILIGMQDTGFNNLNHACFTSLNVIAAYDFLNHDPNVGDEGDLGSGSHGTRTLSVIAGLDSTRFIGVAPEALFALTKTENSNSETPVEEDYWVAGLWFHDSLGVDVLSSSVSYRDWYNYEQRDGETAPTTRAADSAAAAGMVIVNSMGNTGGHVWPNSKLGVPADARGVISVGGVSRDSSYWTSASQGPTFDGRIKPDVATLASSVYTASSSDDSNYYIRSGTSFSCPAVAGLAALVLEANGDLTPAQVMEVIHRTASHPDNPDTLTGYGIPNAWEAVLLARSLEVTVQLLLTSEVGLSVFPNPANSRATIRFNAGNSPFSTFMFDVRGRRIYDYPPEITAPIEIDLSLLGAGLYIVRRGNNVTPLVILR